MLNFFVKLLSGLNLEHNASITLLKVHSACCETSASQRRRRIHYTVKATALGTFPPTRLGKQRTSSLRKLGRSKVAAATIPWVVCGLVLQSRLS